MYEDREEQDRGIRSQHKNKGKRNTKKNLRELRDMINESLDKNIDWEDVLDEGEENER